MTVNSTPRHNSGRNSTRVDLFWSFLGYGVHMVCQIAIVVVMARLAPIEDVGRYGYAIAVCTIVIVLTNLNLRVGYATDFSRTNALGVYVAIRIVTVFVAFIAIVGLSTAIVGDDVRLFHIIVIMAVAKCAEAMSDIFYGSIQKARQMQVLACSLMLRGGLTVMVFGALMGVTQNLEVALLSQAIVWWAVMLAYDYRRANRLEACRARFRWRDMWQVAREAIPLGLAELFSAISGNAPRIIVKMTLGLTEAGVFTAVGYVIQAGTVFGMSVSHAVSSRLAKMFRDGLIRPYVRLTLIFSTFMFSIGVGSIIISELYGDTLLWLGFGQEYVEYQYLLSLFMCIMMINITNATIRTALVAQRAFSVYAKSRLGLAVGMVVFVCIGAVTGDLANVAIGMILVNSVYLAANVFFVWRGVRQVRMEQEGGAVGAACVNP